MWPGLLYISPIITTRAAEQVLNELVEDDKNLTVNGAQFSVGMISLLKEGEQKKKNSTSLYHPSNPPLFPLVLQLPFRLNGFLLEMQMFSRVTLLQNIVE